jgi:hypothetical protein
VAAGRADTDNHSVVAVLRPLTIYTCARIRLHHHLAGLIFFALFAAPALFRVFSDMTGGGSDHREKTRASQ